ncbi:hypothetical protein GUJ93_ZPchr0002g25034 [Zizania palustris]|uniref:DRBM domain-containing protein n=1 Tax=Zizania palustris TaxID=103762 RepID=A0A8J5SC13_ZIZPA|nr:hypothetical protein GUJ93_ZPchr0002g25034 [Zizania palustris]
MLEEIALKCGSKVEYRASLCDTSELHFSIEVYWNFYSMTMIGWIVGEKVGEGIGRTRKEAQCQAAEISLRNLANKYLSSEPNKMSDMKENGFGGSIAALKELCTVEGYNLVFQARTSPDGSVGKETYAEVEVGGQILGNGVGTTWEEAKLQFV